MTVHSSPQHSGLLKGGALLTLLGVMLVFSILGASLVDLTSTSQSTHLSANAASRAYYLAESGLQYAQKVHREEGWLHGRQRTLQFQGGEFVTVTRLDGVFWAVSTANPATAMQARAKVPKAVDLRSGDPFETARFASDFVIFGEDDYTTHSSSDIDGSVALTEGHLTLNGDVNGDIVADRVTFDAIATVDGSIFSANQVHIRNGDVTGDIHAAGSVTMQADTTLVGGWVFSEDSVYIIQGASVAGNVNAANGDVVLTGGASIGAANAPVEVRASGDVTLEGSGTIYGDVYAGGSVTLTGGTRIFGNVFAGGSVSSTNGTIISGNIVSNSPDYLEPPIPPSLSVLDDLALPEAAQFSSGGSNHITRAFQSSSLPPGSYGRLQPNGWNGGAELTLSAGLSGHGQYFFNEVTLGQSLTLKLNLSGTHDIRVFVNGNIQGNGDLRVQVSTDGSTYHDITSPNVDPNLAARVYWESTGNFNLAYSSKWFGTVYTPNGSLTSAWGPTMVGQFVAKQGHYLPGGTITYVSSNYLKAKSDSGN